MRAKRSALSQQVTKKHIKTDAHKDKANTRQNKNIKDPQKKYHHGKVSKIFYWRALTGLTAPTSPLIQMWIKTHRCLVCMKDPLLINASSPKTYKSRYNLFKDERVRAWCFVCGWAHLHLTIGIILLSIQMKILLSYYLCFISFFNLDLYLLRNDTSIS